MRTWGWRRAARLALCLLAGIHGAGCSTSGDGFGVTQLIHPQAPAPGFSPNTPANALRLLEWSYNNRSLSVYPELFSDDFRFLCSSIDSAGAAWRGAPWTREDELVFATHLFVGGSPTQPAASRIRLSLDRNFFVSPDPNHAPWDPTGRWHKQIRTTIALEVVTGDGGNSAILGHANFSLVRGDSTAIPEDLRLRGVGSDSSRWYIRRWDDETAVAGSVANGSRAREPAAAARRPGELDALPGKNMTWCQLRALYR